MQNMFMLEMYSIPDQVMMSDKKNEGGNAKVGGDDDLAMPLLLLRHIFLS